MRVLLRLFTSVLILVLIALNIGNNINDVVYPISLTVILVVFWHIDRKLSEKKLIE